MTKLFLPIAFLLLSVTGYTQKVIFNIVTNQDSVQIYFQEELMGEAPLEFKESLKFSDTNEYVLQLKRSGYQTKMIKYTSPPEEKKVLLREDLQPDRFELEDATCISIPDFKLVKYKIDESATIGYSRSKFRKEQKKPIVFKENDFEWLITLFSETFYSEFDLIFPNHQEDNIFYTKKKIAEKSTTIEIGAVIKSIDLDMFLNNKPKFLPKEIEYTRECELEIEWQIYDSKSEKIYKYPVKSSARIFFFSQRYILSSSINDILIKSFRNNVANLLLRTSIISDLKHIKEGNSNHVKDKVDNPIYLSKVSNQQSFNSLPELFEDIKTSVVTINSRDGHGSGFFISEDGLILTNYHVVGDYDEVKVVLQNKMKITAKVIRVNMNEDLAILKVDGEGFKFMDISGAYQAKVGEDVYAIGTPADLSLGQTITKGMVSGFREFDEKKLIQTDVSMNPGNSGGPLINTKGKVLGLVSMKLIANEIEGIGFAIPIEQAIKILNIKFKD